MHKDTEDFIKKYFGINQTIMDLFIQYKIDKFIMDELLFYKANKNNIKLSYVQFQYNLSNKIIKKYSVFYDALLKIK